jgi:MOSC domain-containing protein YiiM
MAKGEAPAQGAQQFERRVPGGPIRQLHLRTRVQYPACTTHQRPSPSATPQASIPKTDSTK